MRNAEHDLGMSLLEEEFEPQTENPLSNRLVEVTYFRKRRTGLSVDVAILVYGDGRMVRRVGKRLFPYQKGDPIYA